MTSVAVPRYSQQLHERFASINPYHLSCMYKLPYEEHALDALCSLEYSDDGGNDNSREDLFNCIQDTGQGESGVIQTSLEALRLCTGRQLKPCEDMKTWHGRFGGRDISLDKFYKNIAVDTRKDRLINTVRYISF